MDVGSMVAESSEDQVRPKGSPVVELKGFTKDYGKFRAVEDIDLEVNEGEIFGFLGPNGAGKTTTIRTMLDFIRRTSGEVKLFGLDSETGSMTIRERIGYLPGEFGLYEGFRVDDFLRYFLDLRGASDKVPRMERLAAEFDLPLDRKIGELSKGNRQKVGLVQAFMHRPELVILDEPTSGLDPLMQQKFYKLAREEQRRGCTIFMSSHLLAEVEHICDRVAIIREGRIVMVDHLKALKDRVGKVLTVTFDEEVAVEDLQLEGVTDLERVNNTYRMTIRTDIDKVIKKVASHRVQSMTMETFSLEELFLAMYGGETDGDEGATVNGGNE
jgi:ABC-2 type transport system ATP-binding protein